MNTRLFRDMPGLDWCLEVRHAVFSPPLERADDLRVARDALEGWVSEARLAFVDGAYLAVAAATKDEAQRFEAEVRRAIAGDDLYLVTAIYHRHGVHGQWEKIEQDEALTDEEIEAELQAAVDADDAGAYDLAVFSRVEPLTAATAKWAFERLCAGDPWSTVLQRDDGITRFISAVEARWPPVDELWPDSYAPPDPRVFESPWSLELDVSPAHVLASFVPSRVEDAVPHFIEIALEHGLYVFDPQTDVLHSPTGVAHG